MCLGCEVPQSACSVGQKSQSQFLLHKEKAVLRDGRVPVNDPGEIGKRAGFERG